MSEAKRNEEDTSPEKRTSKGSKNKTPGWRIWHRVGRTERPMGAEGPETIKRAEFENLKGRGMPGTVILVDNKGKIVDQILGFADDEVRRYKDENGKQYKPTLVNMGQKNPVDLRRIKDIIAAMPETDPDLDPDDSVTQKILEELTKPKEPSVPNIPKEPPKPPSPRSKRIESSPCIGGALGFVSAVFAARSKFDELRKLENRVRAKRRRFVMELLIRAAVGAPICKTTVEVAFVDAEDTEGGVK